MATEFKLPELGENIGKVDVTGVLVSVGDTIAVDDPVLEIETEKSGFDVPSTVAGVIKEVRVSAGDKAEVGQVILVVEESAGAETSGSTEAPAPEKAEEKAEEPAVEQAPKEEPKPAATAT